MATDKITLDEVKAQLSVDHDLDNALLTRLIDVSLEVAQSHIGKTFGDVLDDKTVVFNESIKHGCLMFIAHLYANRESTTDLTLKETPLAVKALWGVYREPCVY